MRGIGFLGLTTALFWLFVGIGVTKSLLDRPHREHWWEGGGSAYGGLENTGGAKPVVTEPDERWRDL